VPNTSNPAYQIAINAVNKDSFPQFFVENYILGSNFAKDKSAYTPGPLATEYNGMTKLLDTSSITAVAGQPLNITIVIAGRGLGTEARWSLRAGRRRSTLPKGSGPEPA
jgi:hypothetical protein